MSEIAIDLRNITVTRRGKTVLQDISLKLIKGRFLGIVGPNGAGKTTLLTVMNGMCRVSGGEVYILGEEITQVNASIVRRRIGYLSQVMNIDPRAPIFVREVIMIGRWAKRGLLKRSTLEENRIVERIARQVRVEHLLHRPIGHLSGGEHQKVEIARVLAQEPEILLLDEPTANLDLAAQKEIIELVEMIYKDQGLTVVLVTHNLGHLPPCCTDVVLLKDGRVEAFGPKKETLSLENLSRLYECEIDRVEFAGRTLILPK